MGRRKKTTEDFINDATRVHGTRYNYSGSRYIGALDKITINCKEHGDFPQRPYDHLSGSGCPVCSKEVRSFSPEVWIEKSKERHGDRYEYLKVYHKGGVPYIDFICSLHGKQSQKADIHTKAVCGCKDCAYITRRDSRVYTLETFKRACEKKHKNKYNYSLIQSYYNNKDVVTIICPIHGEFTQKAADHLAGNGCQDCGRDATKLLFGYTQDTYKAKCNQVHAQLYDYSLVKYVDTKNDIEIICKSHGSFTQNSRAHLRGQGCPKCANETKVAHFFTKNIEAKKDILLSKEGFLYILKLPELGEDIYKIGVSVDIHRRIQDIKRQSIINPEVYLKYKSNKYDCHVIEKELHDLWKKLNYTSPVSFQGHTECFTLCESDLISISAYLQLKEGSIV